MPSGKQRGPPKKREKINKNGGLILGKIFGHSRIGEELGLVDVQKNVQDGDRPGRRIEKVQADPWQSASFCLEDVWFGGQGWFLYNN